LRHLITPFLLGNIGRPEAPVMVLGGGTR
jgi:hypothetical protein